MYKGYLYIENILFRPSSIDMVILKNIETLEETLSCRCHIFHLVFVLILFKYIRQHAASQLGTDFPGPLKRQVW